MQIFNKTNNSINLLYSSRYRLSVKFSDLTGNPSNGHFVKIMLYRSPSAIIHCIRLLGKNVASQAIEFHRIVVKK